MAMNETTTSRALLTGLDPGWMERVRWWQQGATRGVLGPKIVALIRVLLDILVTHMNREGAARHMREALAAGASRAEVLAVIKLASVIGIHSYAAAAPEFGAAMRAVGRSPVPAHAAPTPATDAMRAEGALNPAWSDIERWDPEWLERFLRMGSAPWTDAVLDARVIELLCVAGDASVTHLWPSGIRRHAEAALRYGATPEELLEVLRIVAGQGVESVELAAPILESLCAENAVAGE